MEPTLKMGGKEEQVSLLRRQGSYLFSASVCSVQKESTGEVMAETSVLRAARPVQNISERLQLLGFNLYKHACGQRGACVSGPLQSMIHTVLTIKKVCAEKQMLTPVPSENGGTRAAAGSAGFRWVFPI